MFDQSVLLQIIRILFYSRPSPYNHYISFNLVKTTCIAARAVNALFGFPFWLIAARFYSPVDIGLPSAALSGASLLAMLASPGLGYELIRFLTHLGKNASCMINSCAGSHLTDGH
jgi:hypothetical protein